MPRRRQAPSFEALPLGRCPEPFDHPEWLFELKLDGFRALAHVRAGRAELVSRRGYVYRAFDALCRDVARAVRARAAVLDGEVVCLDDEGRSTFLPLLYRRGDPCFFAFDLLSLEGVDLRARPLVERKKMLRQLLGRQRGRVRYLAHVAGRGVELFRLACERDLEGVVAKWRRAPYQLVRGERSPWVKIKNRDYTQARDRHELFDGFRQRTA